LQRLVIKLRVSKDKLFYIQEGIRDCDSSKKLIQSLRTERKVKVLQGDEIFVFD